MSDIVRTNWPPGSEVGGLAGEERGVIDRVRYGRPHAADDRKTVSVVSVDTRAEEWNDRFERIVDEELEGSGEEPDAGALIAEGLALLQNATDKALGHLERQLIDHFAREVATLSANIAKLEGDRAAERKRHRNELAGLRMELAQQAKDRGAEAERVAAEIQLLQGELAEQRAVDRLRHNRSGRSHDAAVRLKLARSELERQAKGAA